jgi:hypothetical protein
VKHSVQIATVLLLFCSPLFLPAAAQAPDDLEIRAVEAKWSKGAPRISFPAREARDRRIKNRLNSGLPQTIVTRTYAYSEAGKPLALSVRSCRVVYDLWEDVYRVQLQTERRSGSQVFRDIDKVRRHCLQVKDQPLGSAADFRRHRGRRIYFAAIIEINPLSDKTVERIRRWLARPTSRDSLTTREAFFGSFVSIFVNRQIGSAERIFRFRSPLVRVP